MGCISPFSLIRRRQGNEILLLQKHYDLWIGSTALVVWTLSMGSTICVCPCVGRVMCACLCAATVCMHVLTFLLIPKLPPQTLLQQITVL